MTLIITTARARTFTGNALFPPSCISMRGFGGATVPVMNCVVHGVAAILELGFGRAYRQVRTGNRLHS
jgi:hypothetical protein